MIRTLVERLPRAAFLLVSPLVPLARRVAIERSLRGFEEALRLRRADAVIVSFGKSGRTWLRVMLSRFYGVRHGLPRGSLMGFDNLARKHPQIPRLLFTHDNYLSDYTGHKQDKSDYLRHKVVLLVRDPADVAVSQYFQWSHRMKARKKRINAYPAHGSKMDIADFVLDGGCVLQRIIDFTNLWAAEAARFQDSLKILRYEDLRSDPGGKLTELLEFLGTPGQASEVSEAVEFASVNNMRRMERGRSFRGGGRRMRAGDEANPDSYKVRRAKVGGYVDYFNAGEIARIDGMINAQLASSLGYARPTPEFQDTGSQHGIE